MVSASDIDHSRKCLKDNVLLPQESFWVKSVTMDSAFDKLDAAGFLEIWQHFDADGKWNESHMFISKQLLKSDGFFLCIL